MSGDPKKPEEQGAMHLSLDIVPARHQSFDPPVPRPAVEGVERVPVAVEVWGALPELAERERGVDRIM